MNPRTWQNSEVTITVDHDLCSGQEACVEDCPTNVYAMENGKAVVVALDECIQCCVCVEVCPEKAITHSAC